MEDKEIWKPIIGYVGLYEVSSHGNVRSLKRAVTRKNNTLHTVQAKILKFGFTISDKTKGYHTVALSGVGKLRTFKVHRLVAIAFCDGFKKGLSVNHIDGNKLNNHYTNLEWCTHQENSKHAFETGLLDNSMLQRKPIVQLNMKGEFVNDVFSASSMTKKGFDKGHILKCCQGVRKSHGGFKWMYKEDYESKEETV